MEKELRRTHEGKAYRIESWNPEKKSEPPLTCIKVPPLSNRFISTGTFLIKALTVKCSYRLTKIKLFFRFINSFCDCSFGFIEWALQIREVVWLSMMVCDRVRRSDPSSLSNISETSFYQCKHILDRFRIIHFPSTIASYIDWWGVGKYSSIPDVVMLHYVKVVKGTCACR